MLMYSVNRSSVINLALFWKQVFSYIKFVSKDRACPNGTPFRHNTLGKAPGFTHKYKTRLKRLACEKH